VAGPSRSRTSLGDQTGIQTPHSQERMKRPSVIFSLELLTLIAVVLLTTRRSVPNPASLSQAEFLAMVQSNLLTQVRVYYPAKLGQVDGVPVMLNEVRGTFNQTDPAGQILKAKGVPTESAFIARVHLTPELEGKLLAKTNVSIIEPNAFVQKARERFVRSK